METQNPIFEKIISVHTTKDYAMFLPIQGNRTKNLFHLNKLKKSIKKNYLFTVITVNEKYEIIDGQHRFEILKELGLAVNYVICEGYGLNEVHILNANAKTWTANDYETAYCDLGYEHYLCYSQFKKKYGIAHNETISVLSGVVKGVKDADFREGKFVVTSLEQAEERMEKIEKIQKYYEGARRRNFIYAIIGLLKNPNFDFDIFLGKLKKNASLMKDCTTVANYRSLIEDIYNKGSKIKTNLRF